MFSFESNFKNILAKDLMSKNPFTIDSNMLATKALSIMNKNKITQIIVTKNGFYSGIIHLHNIINEGLS